ncbi:hypothetical protein EDD86DRAFT_204731 [Gorgonomyces haynaldii]|nr:hypothetical protein EDD86DRAFT_204731 [Gorgonomyces haynaldii]
MKVLNWHLFTYQSLKRSLLEKEPIPMLHFHWTKHSILKGRTTNLMQETDRGYDCIQMLQELRQQPELGVIDKYLSHSPEPGLVLDTAIFYLYNSPILESLIQYFDRHKPYPETIAWLIRQHGQDMLELGSKFQLMNEPAVLYEHLRLLNENEQHQEAFGRLIALPTENYPELVKERMITLLGVQEDRRAWQYFPQITNPSRRLLRALGKHYSSIESVEGCSFVQYSRENNIDTSLVLRTMAEAYYTTQDDQRMRMVLDYLNTLESHSRRSEKQYILLLLKQQQLKRALEHIRYLCMDLSDLDPMYYLKPCFDHGIKTKSASDLDLILQTKRVVRAVFPPSFFKDLKNKFGPDPLIDHIFKAPVQQRAKRLIPPPKQAKPVRGSNEWQL